MHCNYRLNSQQLSVPIRGAARTTKRRPRPAQMRIIAEKTHDWLHTADKNNNSDEQAYLACSANVTSLIPCTPWTNPIYRFVQNCNVFSLSSMVRDDCSNGARYKFDPSTGLWWLHRVCHHSRYYCITIAHGYYHYVNRYDAEQYRLNIIIKIIAFLPAAATDKRALQLTSDAAPRSRTSGRT